MSSKLKIKSIRNTDSLAYLNGFIVDYSTPSSDKTWEMVSRGGKNRLESELFCNESFCDAVMIFAKNKEGTKLIVLKEYRVTAGKYVYMLPAGLVDSGENLEVAAKREFKEETGLDLDIVKISKERYTSIGISNEKIAIAFGYYQGIPSKENQEDSEDAEILVVDKEMAIEILKSGEVSIRTAMFFEHFFNLNDFI
ncbi:MAG: NUDIX hydrolase [Acidaminobacteraceae bacterium]